MSPLLHQFFNKTLFSYGALVSFCSEAAVHGSRADNQGPMNLYGALPFADFV
jgi:hypothetical protein